MANSTQYSDEQAAHALAALKANGGNMQKTARMLGIPRTTLRQWAGQVIKSVPKTVPAQLIMDKTVEIADRLEHVALLAVGPDMDTALASASAKDRAIVAGIAIEKRQLLIGAPTSRTESLQVTLVAQGTLNELGDRTLMALKAGNK